MDRYKIHTVQTRAELDACIDSQWDGFATEEFWTFWFPLDTEAHLTGHTDPAKRAAAVQDSKDRFWNEHINDPCSTWIYVADESKRGAGDDGVGEAPYVLGSCQWRVYEKNPFADPLPAIECPPWTKGNIGNKFVLDFAGKIFTPRVSWMARPHVGLSWMAVRTEWQQRGIGSAMMEWGVQRADKLGLEIFIEGSDYGKPLYQKYGNRNLRTVWVDHNAADANDEWRAMERKYLPKGFHYHLMWRPVNGDWSDGAEKVWEERYKVWKPQLAEDGRYFVGRS